ncbi:HNH endonuclease [Paenarthrobacter nicotinovorans]|uniref:HNH endonuclease n=1 Tax=Paenarthrobacter nicotinovorans TaxID=29320 RepID=UPI0037FFEC41
MSIQATTNRQQAARDEDMACEALEDIAKQIVERTAAISRWGVDEPYDEVMRQIRGLVLAEIGYVKAPNTKRNRARNKISAALRTAVYERDGYACVSCGQRRQLSLDHIHPYSLGGQDTYENLQTLCKSCNSSKGVSVE